MFDITFFSHPQSRDSGDYLHRVLWPAKALGKLITTQSIQSSHPDYLKIILQANILVIKMVVDQELLRIIQQRNRSGRISIYEISDDFEDFPSTLPSYPFYKRKDIQQLIRELASAASGIQFSSSFLQSKYSHLNSHHATFINQCHKVPPLRKHENSKITLGWAGSSGHLADATRLAEILQTWDNLKQINFAVMADSVIVDVFRKHHINISVTHPGTMQSYLKFLNSIDIGIAMIDANDFSLGRSDGKFIEYASQGVVAVCQNRGSYAETIKHGKTGFLFDDDPGLLKTLDQLIHNHQLRNTIRESAYQYLCNYRTHEYAATTRLKFYTSLSQKHHNSSNPKPFKEIIHPIEASLLQAMLLHRNNQLPEALDIYMHLLEAAPEFHIIWQRLRDLYHQTNCTEQATICNTEINRILDATFQ